MVDGAGNTSPAVDRIVASGRRNAYLPQRVLAWLLLVGFGSAFAVSLLLAVTWGLVAIIERMSNVDSASDMGSGGMLLTIVAVLAFSGLLTLLGYGALREVRQLDRLRLVIDRHGIAREDGAPIVVRWERIRHIIVTRGRTGTRRLLVDDGTGPEATPEDAAMSVRTIVGRARARFAIDTPIDRLDVAPEEMIRTIRHHSGHRLPDI